MGITVTHDMPTGDHLQRMLETELEVKSPLLGAVNSSQFNKAMWNEWDYDRAVKDGFKRATWVYIAVHKLAMSMGAIEWVVEKRDNNAANGWSRAPDSPLQALLDQPNEYWTTASYMYRLVVSLYLGGNAVTHKVRGARGIVTELWLLNPSRVSPIPDRKKYLEGYEIKNKDGKVDTILKPTEVIHQQFVDPGNPYWGMAPIMAAAKSVDTEIEAQDWQKLSYQERCVPDGVLTHPRELTMQQWADARKQIGEQLAGPANARKIMILGGGATFQGLSLTPLEMDFIHSRKFTREEILAVHQVPPPTVGIYDNGTFNNVATARKIFWLDTMIPLADAVCDSLNLSLAPEFGPEYRVAFDVSSIEPMFSIFMEKLDAAAKLQALGYSQNAINARLDLGMPEGAHGDIEWVPAGLMPAGIAAIDTFGDE